MIARSSYRCAAWMQATPLAQTLRQWGPGPNILRSPETVA
jgi:hypothetical protein